LLDLDALRRGGISIEEAEGILSLDGLPRSVLEIASSLRDESLGREIRFLIPQPRFPSVSVTGAKCALRCEHCKGHFLTGMANTNTPEKLKDFCSRLYAEGGVGVLVSGGSDPKGHVPLEEFLDAITWVKENTSLIVNLHTGLLNPGQAEDIASTGADVVSMDVVGSDDTIKGVYGLDATVKDYAESLVNLRDARVPYLVPHVCAGLDFGEIKGEARALEIIGDVDPDIIVIIAREAPLSRDDCQDRRGGEADAQRHQRRHRVHAPQSREELGGASRDPSRRRQDRPPLQIHCGVRPQRRIHG
jgi:hypothetical protein